MPILDSPTTPKRGGAPTAASTTPLENARELVTTETYRAPRSGLSAETGGWRVRPLTRIDAALAVGLFALALLARWPFIARGETLLHSDEAIVGLMAQDIAAGDRFPIYFYGQRYMGALEAYVIAAISPLFDNPIHALRLGPACCFAVMVAVQFCMLTRWFGRAGGVMGATTLLAASPMFMQWSISARGGYVEIMLWGAMLLWAYSEWFVLGSECKMQNVKCKMTESRTSGSAASKQLDGGTGLRARLRRHSKFLFGAIIGSGMWINPSIVLFIAPIVAHALLNRPLAMARRTPEFGARLSTGTHWTQRATLPIAALTAVLLLNCTWAIWVADHEIHSELLLGLVPKPTAMLILCLGGAIALLFLWKRTTLIQRARALATENAALILGVLVGAAPAVLYVVQSILGLRTMDPSLPLGFRPIWLAGDTLLYLILGLPLLFGPDPRGFLQLVGVGRDTATLPLGGAAAVLVSIGGWLVIGCLLAAFAILLYSNRDSLSRLLRLQPANHPPAMLLVIGVATTLGLYVLGGCTLDFTTIRYLVPLWVFLPGILAAAFVSRRFRRIGRAAPLCACAAWAIGQCAMHSQLGAPHPLRRVADALVQRGIDPAVAEPLDAHLLSYLTQQKCRTIEFESFWPRMPHFFPLVRRDEPMDYVVQTQELDRTWDWIRGGWPGEPPPETCRFLWPRLRYALNTNPGLLLSREPLPDGYELIRLREPLADRNLLE